MRRGGDENIVRYAAPAPAEEEEELELEENQPLSEVALQFDLKIKILLRQKKFC